MSPWVMEEGLKNDDEISEIVDMLLVDACCTAPPVRMREMARVCNVQLDFVDLAAYSPRVDQYDARLGADARLMTGLTRHLIWVQQPSGDGKRVVSHATRSRFSIAHELGHLFLHAGQGINVFAQARNPYQDEALEREANHFAAMLLMPRRWVEQQIDDCSCFDHLRHAFWVSRQAMNHRLQDLVLCHRVANAPCAGAAHQIQAALQADPFHPLNVYGGSVTSDPYEDYLIAMQTNAGIT